MTTIRRFCRKNRAELPREKVVLDRDVLPPSPDSSEEYAKPAEVQSIIGDGSVGIRDKAAMAIALCMGPDESRFANQFNLHACPQITAGLGADRGSWDLVRAPPVVRLI